MFFNFLSTALLLGGLFFSSLIQAEAWKDTEWIKLLRYKKTLLGAYESEADSPNFFIHPEGKTHPQLEFEAFKDQAQRNQFSNSDQHPLCRFPARVDFLKRKIPDLKLPQITCGKFNTFKEGLKAKTVSLVFSSYYLNNPASSFGHTFLRLGKGEKVSELLDTGINYGADTGRANPIVFVLGAFTGYFTGTYNAIPYYYKVREYNDFESRDLWTYHLDFNQKEIDQMVRHIWELDQGGFRYYFLTENCSYHALMILEAVRPGLNLVSHLPDRYIIPSDTLKVVVDQKIVKNITFRASASTQFYHQLDELSRTEKAEMNRLLNKKDPLHQLTPERKMKVYDTAISYVDYKFAEDILQEKKEIFDFKRDLLLKRAQIPLQSPNLQFSQKELEKPHEGHSSGRVTLGGLSLGDHQFLNLNYRFAFHDFLDDQHAYMNNARVEMFSFKTITDGRKINLTDFSIADYYSVGSFDEYSKSFSWKLKFGQWQTFQKGLQGLTSTGMIAGYGYSYQIKNISPFLLASFESSYVSEKFHKLKLAYGADLGLLVKLSESVRALSLYEWRNHPWRENILKNEIRYMKRTQGVGLFFNHHESQNFNEVGLQYHHYLK